MISSGVWLGRPRLLFLDEPTTGLDPLSRATIWEVVRDLVITTGTANELKRNAGGLALIIEVDDNVNPDSLDRQFIENDIEAPSAISATKYRAAVDRDPLCALSDVAASLAAAGIEVRSLGLGAPSLDDVFRGLTGIQDRESNEVAA